MRILAASAPTTPSSARNGAKAGTSGLTWVLDPIDGTRAFISGTTTWGVLIALCDADGPFLGVIDQPYTQERFDRRAGPLRNCAARTAPALADPRHDRAGSGDPVLDLSRDRHRPCRTRGVPAGRDSACKLTRYGMDCYAYALLAAGHIDLVIEAGLNSL